MASSEYVPEWDVYRDDDGAPVTITDIQVRAVWHALRVVELVRKHERYASLWDNPQPNIWKSRLLGRMLVHGRPPTRTRPPTIFSAPDWSELEGGDPFEGTAKDLR